MESIIRDINLAESGERKIEWVKRNCDLLRMLEEEFSKTKPFAGKKVALSVHLEAKTAYLCKVLKAGGAEMYVTGSNPLSTQDDVAAALVKAGLNVFAWYNATPEEYEAHIRKVLEVGPNVIIDDGGDLVHMMHTEFVDLIPNVIGGCEETTTGIIRLEAMNKKGELKFPMVRVNNADCKHFSSSFHNRCFPENSGLQPECFFDSLHQIYRPLYMHPKDALPQIRTPKQDILLLHIRKFPACSYRVWPSTYK